MWKLVMSFFVLLVLLVHIECQSITWSPCPVITPSQEVQAEKLDIVTRMRKSLQNFESYQFETVYTSQTTVRAECGLMALPLLYEVRNDNRTISVFVKKIPSRIPSNRVGQLWLLQGGPGAPGNAFDSIAEILLNELQDKYDLYIPDFRGTGRSSLLQCPVAQASSVNPNPVACFAEIASQYGVNGLAGFSTTAAATDLYHLINNTKQSGDRVVVYGVSYGTFLLNRFLYLYPQIADRAIADSVLPNSVDYTERADHGNEAGLALNQACIDDAFCSSKFAAFGGVNATMTDVLSGNTCVRYSTSQGLNLKAVLLTFLDNFFLRKLVFPIIYRMKRCSPSDIAVLGRIFAPTVSAELNSINGTAKMSDAILYLVSGSELASRPVRYNASHWVTKYSSTPPFYYNPAGALITTVYQSIASYLYPATEKVYATNYTNPLLIIHGTIDTRTPTSFYNEWINAFRGMNNVKTVLFKNTPHGVAFSTPIRGVRSYCGVRVMVDFLNTPNQTPNSSCITDGSTLDSPIMFFNLSASTLDASLVRTFGGEDLYESSGNSLTASVLLLFGLMLLLL